HGSLTLDSRIGEGSTFRLTLPSNAEMSVARISHQQEQGNGSTTPPENKAAESDSAAISS
ncbi:MAG TPA: hypothetical protein VFT29_00335, partial [Gemmatimonadaceae bacterium]|nr:hypothetical protein [Gemmatimonadaceae bacterium]